MGSKLTATESTVVGQQGSNQRTQQCLNVLVFNRDPELRLFLDKALLLGNASVTTCLTCAEVDASMEAGSYGLLLVGIDSPETMDFLRATARCNGGTPVVAIARTATPELVRDVMKSGVADFLFGSMDVRSVLPRLISILDGRRQGGEKISALTSAAQVKADEEDERATEQRSVDQEYPIICSSKKMRRVLEMAATVAPTESTVLIQGESGTGKEVIAKRIHHLSNRRDRPFVEVNCGALPENLLESQLFGHEKGSFTGAIQRQAGLFEIANQSTLFLDEIGEMSLDMQVKLLRALQFGEFRRIGGSRLIKVDVRVIAATNKNLKEEVAQSRFRADLFYRLNVICLDLPPLRERLEEVPELVVAFAERLANERNLPPKEFSEEAVQKLQKYRWTGNVRELENAVERFILLAKGDRVDGSDVEEYLDGSLESNTESPFAATLTLNEMKKVHIANVLRSNNGNKMKSARMLKINVKTLYNLIKSLGITID